MELRSIVPDRQDLRGRTFSATLLSGILGLLSSCGGAEPATPTSTPTSTTTPTASASSPDVVVGATPPYVSSGWSAEVRAGLDTARAATEKYQDIEVAKAEGYELGFGCLNWLGSGWVNVDLVADPTIHLDAPEVLAYDGDHQLVGIEYLVYLDDEPTRPEVMGLPMEGPIIVARSPLVRENYWYLRAWLYQTNPDGMFSDQNRTVSC